MNSHPNRRTFLKTASLAAATGTAVAAGLTPLPASAVEPITRNGTAKFKFSLAAYSYRKLLSGEKPEMTMEDFVRECARMQLDGTEPTSYWFPDPPSSEYLLNLKKLAFDLGLTISGTAVRNDFCLPPGKDRDKWIAHVKQWSDYAAVMGAPTIRIFSGHKQKGQTQEEAHKLCVEAIEECCDYSGKKGVYLALENHGGLSIPIESMLRILGDVKSPWFGINLDTGNFRSRRRLCRHGEGRSVCGQRPGETEDARSGRQVDPHRFPATGEDPQGIWISGFHRPGRRRRRGSEGGMPEVD